MQNLSQTGFGNERLFVWRSRPGWLQGVLEPGLHPWHLDPLALALVWLCLLSYCGSQGSCSTVAPDHSILMTFLPRGLQRRIFPSLCRARGSCEMCISLALTGSCFQVPSTMKALVPKAWHCCVVLSLHSCTEQPCMCGSLCRLMRPV